MPEDNQIVVGAGEPVAFPQDGPSNGVIVRLTDGDFLLPNIGIYEITFQVSVTEAGQLIVVLNDIEQPSTVVGRTAISSQIVGVYLISTEIINSILSISNPINANTSLTITQSAGGDNPVTAHLIIKQLV
jgi:hypothetical protein